MDPIAAVLADPRFLGVWSALGVASLGVLLVDLTRNNAHISPMMKWVWGFTVLYSGPLGLAGYFWSGRRQIPQDTLWRRGFRSVAHCYSGCGAGEIVGVLLASGLLSLGTWWVAGITFVLAYISGFAMTTGPLLQEGEPLRSALSDAFYSETASITVMEVTAVSVDLLLGRSATIDEPLFWSAMVVSLSAGLLAAYPVNVLLVDHGVKEGMMNPKETTA